MNNQRLGYQRLAEALVDRGLVEAQAIQDALSMSSHGGLPFPEALVTARLVSDWELSNVVCELYGLPFLTVDIADPDTESMRGLDLNFLIENGLVPLSRHGQVLTICMPASVPAEILGCIAAESDLQILAVVGTVQSNRRWLEKNMEPAAELASTDINLSVESSEWGNLFDEADAAVLQELDVDIEPIKKLSILQDLSEESALPGPGDGPIESERPKRVIPDPPDGTIL